jgi:hypothetical protein
MDKSQRVNLPPKSDRTVWGLSVGWAIADLLRGDFKPSQYGRIILKQMIEELSA